MDDLEGILKFTEEELSAMQVALDGYGIKLPSFAKIGGILAAEISEDEALDHAAILKINQALDEEWLKDNAILLTYCMNTFLSFSEPNKRIITMI